MSDHDVHEKSSFISLREEAFYEMDIGDVRSMYL
ncbi:hypothetical protein P343_17990 [Sporolactobacillus laevolacticus DSM 442]|uniref:Uncharacterized protein n=1 Tax=Sporolactobacillus laevolacticus DSM 442 TaxID=1395513 RepID=V6J0K8_9BACL|nr:hypothetical protein P343_17990 [Sporolactobacillus laevolacticus DSM 442]